MNRKSQLGRWPKKNTLKKNKVFFYFPEVEPKLKTRIQFGCKQIKKQWIMKFQENALMTSTAGTFWWFKKKKKKKEEKKSAILISVRQTFLFLHQFFFHLLFFTLIHHFYSLNLTFTYVALQDTYFNISQCLFEAQWIIQKHKITKYFIQKF